mmetsp:Transcript_7218/g.10201  ORF Transcript_7218/g.10201 Transcript_7218/m.10201 type:complete len:116 (+) Transcript_7218:86-433(+)
MVFAESVNLARRLSVRNENDLVQEDFQNNEKFSQAYCENIASKLSSVANLPKACTQYKTVVDTLQRRTESADGVDPFAGMRGAGQARSARASGSDHYAQIQRRYTQSQRFNSKKN